MHKIFFLLFLLSAAAFAQNNQCSSGGVGNSCVGTITAVDASCTKGQCVNMPLAPSVNSAAISVAGTFSATLQFEVSLDNVNFSSASCTPSAGGSATGTAAAAGIWQCPVYGFSYVRVRPSAYTSGTAQVSVQASGGGGSSGAAVSTANTFTAKQTFNGGATINGLPIPPVQSNPNGLLLGTSIGVGSLAPVPLQMGFFPLLMGKLGGNPNNLSHTADMAADGSRTQMWGNWATLHPTLTQNPLTFIEFGVNEIANKGSGATQMQTYAQVMDAMITLMGVPPVSASQQGTGGAMYATNASCTATNFAADNTGVTGYAMSSTTSAATLSCAGVTVNNSVLYVWVRWIDTSGATANVSVDGSVIGTIAGAGPVALSTTNGVVDAPAAYRFTGIANGSHTVLITVTSTTGAGNNLSVIGVGSPWLPISTESFPPGFPRVYVNGVLHKQGGTSDSIGIVYDAQNQTETTTLRGDGLMVWFTDTRSVVNGTTMMLDPTHPDGKGHQAMADAMYATVNGPAAALQGGAINQYPPTLVDGTNQSASADTTMTTIYYALGKFTAPATNTLGGINVQLKASGAITNPTATLTALLFSDDGGSPSKPTTVSTTCSTLSYSQIGAGGYVTLDLYCASGSITNGTVYWPVLKQSVAPTGANILINTVTVANGSATSTDGVTWTLTNAPAQWIVRGRVPYPTLTVGAVDQVALKVNGSGADSLVVNAVGAAKGVNVTSQDGNAFQFTSTNGAGIVGTATNGAGVSVTSTNGAGVVATGTSTGNSGVSAAGSAGGGDINAATGWYRCQEGATPPTIAAAKDFFWCGSPDHAIAFSANNVALQNLMQRFTTNSTYTNATTTFSNVTTLAFPVSASRNYAATCYIMWQGSAATTGPKYQWTGPASPTAVIASMWSNVTASTYTTATATAFSAAMANAGTVSTTTNFMDVLNISVINGTTAGTVQLQAAANGAGTLTIQNGSYCSVQ